MSLASAEDEIPLDGTFQLFLRQHQDFFADLRLPAGRVRAGACSALRRCRLRRHHGGLCEPVALLCLIGMILSANLVGLPVPGAPHLVLDLSTGIQGRQLVANTVIKPVEQCMDGVCEGTAIGIDQVGAIEAGLEIRESKPGCLDIATLDEILDGEGLCLHPLFGGNERRGVTQF